MVLVAPPDFREKQGETNEARSHKPFSERVFERTTRRRLQGTMPSRGTVESSEASEGDGTATAPTVITTLFLIIKNIREASLEWRATDRQPLNIAGDCGESRHPLSLVRERVFERANQRIYILLIDFS